jgi:hypothetical protein
MAFFAGEIAVHAGKMMCLLANGAYADETKDYAASMKAHLDQVKTNIDQLEAYLEEMKAVQIRKMEAEV